jgi:hypothetical protein
MQPREGDMERRRRNAKRNKVFLTALGRDGSVVERSLLSYEEYYGNRVNS